jgi:protein-S-isoprenylcysteine O-methyltransferase Ste14
VGRDPPDGKVEGGVTFAGTVLALAGSALAARSALLLAGRGRPRRGPQPAFVIAGPYLLTRNPLFAGLVLTLAGAALAARSTMLGLLTAAFALAAHEWVVRVEEPQLLARFGPAYAEYLRRVPRWIAGRPGDV